METGPPFYVVIRATRRSSRLQGKGSTFISQLFLRPWVLVRPRESNPRPPALQSSALSTELILPPLNNKSWKQRGSLFLDCLVVKKLGSKFASVHFWTLILLMVWWFSLVSYTYVSPLARLDCLYVPWWFLDMYIITALVFISSLSQEFLNRRKHLTREVSIIDTNLHKNFPQ